MLRAIVVVGLMVGAVALMVFGPRYLRDSGDEAARAECNLLEQPCTWSAESGDWSMSLEPGEAGSQGVEYHLTVNAPEAPSRFLAVLRGESMYMGEYPVPLKQRGDNRYEATFTAPFCSTGTDMIWRIDLQAGQDPISGAPEKLVFRAVK